MARVTDSDYQGEVGVRLYNGCKKEYVWNRGDPSECLLVLSCPVIEVSGKLQLNPSLTVNGPDPSGIKAWVVPPGKESQPLISFLRVKGIQNG